MKRSLIGISLFVLWAGQAYALALAECKRTTHISHGGEIGHLDLGEGRVIWLDWWSQEGSSHDIMIVDCGPGDALRFRTHEDNMTARPPFHKTEQAVRIIEEQHKAARVFVTLPRIAEAVSKIARDVALSKTTEEPCACAALYPDLLGDKTKFTLGS